MVGRIENIVTPVEGDDIFPILHTPPVRVDRRSKPPAEPWPTPTARSTSLSATCSPLASARPAIATGSKRPTRSTPSSIDILTNRWGSLSGFQRTRGALRTLAHTVKALAQRNHQAALIHAGDVPLADAGVRAEVIRFAGESFKSALNADIIRPDSKAAEEDRRRGGEVEKHHIAVGLATTAFLNSFGADKVLGASAPQMLLGVARPDLVCPAACSTTCGTPSSGSLWYMRYEGGRYRFTTEPNLNKVIVEREGAIGDSRIVDLLREAVVKVAAQLAPFRVETGVTSPSDMADEPRLVVGLLGFDLMVGAEHTEATRATAAAILNQRGAAARTNRNAAVLVGADVQGILKARQTARTLAAMRDITSDQTRLKRFNQEQKDQLEERRSGAEERLPQQLAMAYRHLLLLGGDGNGGATLDLVDLGPAKVNDTVPRRVLDHLRNTDRLLDTVLAPAALLTSRFGVLAAGDDAVELDRLLAFFYRLPRLPKLANIDVLRMCLVQGVDNGTFGLASGASWNSPDAVLRFAERVDPSEVQFQPGTWLVRAGAIKTLRAERRPEPSHPASATPMPAPTGFGTGGGTTTGSDTATTSSSNEPTRLTVRVSGVSADKIREVIKVAVMPLAAGGADVSVTLEVVAESATGLPRNTIDLVVKEGLRQLGVHHDVSEK